MPKYDLTNALTKVLEISPQALTVHDTDSYNMIIHTLFETENLYDLRIDKLEVKSSFVLIRE